MTARPFLAVSAVMEVGAGLALLIAPAPAISLVLGFSATEAAALARLAGAALLSLGTACWWARHDDGSAASRALVRGMLVYNAAVVELVLSGSFGLLAPLLWALVVLHGAMALWSVRIVTGQRTTVAPRA